MIYRFDAFSLDTATFELTSRGQVVPIEPQVFALLRLLVEQRDRVVSRDEIIEHVWQGRIVSDAAISSRIKSARQAVGDDGEAQRVIRTIPKTGFRFVAGLEAEMQSIPAVPLATPLTPPEPAELPSHRPSIAVLPFATIGEPDGHEWLAEALPQELISELSRLRWLFVIARASSFRFRGGQAPVTEIGAALAVRYCLSGTIEFSGRSIAIGVELSDTADAGVIWSERFRARLEDVQQVRAQIATAVVNALDLQIPQHEAQRAMLIGPESLDAWSAFHLGLHQLYRFDRAGTTAAARLFERAIALDPGFARAHAGLSFTHWEGAFLRFSDSVPAAVSAARRCAEDAIARDPLDPLCNLVMGRAFWLSGDIEAGLPWLDRAIQLNPNYAQAHYSRGWTTTLMGQGGEGRGEVDAALALSPLDPLVYAMLAVRSFSHTVHGESEAAAHWGEQAALSPGAHALVQLNAAVAHGLNGDDARAQQWLHKIRAQRAGLSTADFLTAFPFRQAGIRDQITGALKRLGV